MTSGPGESPELWGSMVFCHATSLRRGQVTRHTEYIKGSHKKQKQNKGKTPVGNELAEKSMKKTKDQFKSSAKEQLQGDQKVPVHLNCENNK